MGWVCVLGFVARVAGLGLVGALLVDGLGVGAWCVVCFGGRLMLRFWVCCGWCVYVV